MSKITTIRQLVKAISRTNWNLVIDGVFYHKSVYPNQYLDCPFILYGVDEYCREISVITK